MQTVVIRLPAAELPASMAAMRVWLDENRCEPAVFACREEADGIQVSVTFALAREAQAFAARFAGLLHTMMIGTAIEQRVLSPAELVG